MRKKAKLPLIAAILTTFCIGMFFVHYNTMTAAAISAAKPQVRELHPKMNEIKLSWNKIDGADGYNIYLSTDGKSFSLIAAVPDTAFVHTGLTRDTNYYYKVIPYDNSSVGIVEGTSSDVITANSNYRGIDVSKWQGKIDWEKVAASGIKFAMIRVAGHVKKVISEDEYFATNVTEATKAGLKVGVYFYSVAETKAEAVAEANYVLEKIKPYKLTLPVAYDIEDEFYQGKLGKSLNGDLCISFCETIKAGGYTPMVYANLNWLTNYIAYDKIKIYDLWFARYNSVTEYANPIRIWQFSNTGSVSGISGNVDLDYMFDPNETTKGLMNYNQSDKTIRYMVQSGDSFDAIASKYHMSAANLLSLNTSITDTSKIAAGDLIKVNGYSLSTPNKPNIARSTYKSLTLSWSGTSGASGYYVYRANSKGGTYSKVGATNKRSFIDTGLVTKKTYYYKIKAYRDEVTGIKVSSYSPISSQNTILSAVKNLKASSPEYTKIKLTWSAAGGANSYYIYRATSEKGTYKKIATATGTSYTDDKLTFNKTYYYKVKTFRKQDSGNVTSAYSSVVTKKPSLTKPKGIKVSTSSYDKIKLTWNKVTGAKGYIIFRSTSKNGSYKKITSVTNTSYTNSKLKTGTTYYYKIQAYRKSGKKTITSSYSETHSKKTTLSKTSKVTATAGKKKATIKWTKVTGATGYEIYRAIGTGDYTKIKSTSKTSYTNKSLKTNSTYSYKIKAYRTVNGKKVYSSYSSKATVTVK